MKLVHLTLLLLPHLSNAILCRICTNCELEREETFSTCEVNQSCYTLNRANPKMTEMGCGTSCSFVERARTSADECHLCQYDRCNSGKKIIVRGDLLMKSTVMKNVRETTTHSSYIEKEIAPLPVDENDPFPMTRLNGSLVSHHMESSLPLPIPVDESSHMKTEKKEKEGFIHTDYDDILNDELDEEVKFYLDSKVDNERAERVREEEKMRDEKFMKEETTRLDHLVNDHEDYTSITFSQFSLSTLGFSIVLLIH